MNWTVWGAFGFGLVIGWYLYFINRYRKADVTLGDLTTVIGAIGGAAVLKLFGPGSELFGAYGVGLAVGFFAYFASLLILVRMSSAFGVDWFLDGRRQNPGANQGYGSDNQQTVRPAAIDATSTATTQNFYITPHPSPAAQPQAVAQAVRMGGRSSVENACQSLWQTNSASGPGFVAAVANRFGAHLSGSADDIIDQMKERGWKILPDSRSAVQAASQDQLVVAGLKSSDRGAAEGLVAIVTCPLGDAGATLSGYWSSTDPAMAAKGGTGGPLAEYFTSENLGRVLYAFSRP